MQGVPSEIERKWLVDSPPDLGGVTGEEIVQGYIAIAEDGTEVRIRQKGNKHFETIKTEGARVRNELEIELSKAQYEKLWPATEGRRIRKTRYTLKQNDCAIELDVYHAELSGLLIVEVEFPSVAASDSFNVPPWFGTEVTEDERYKNKNLATRVYRTLQ